MMFSDDTSIEYLQRKNLQLVLLLLWIVLITVFIILAMQVNELFICFAIALLINYVLAQPVYYMTKIIRIRFLSVLIIYVSFISGIWLLIYNLLPIIISQLRALKTAIPNLVLNLDNFLIYVAQKLAHYQITVPLDLQNEQELINKTVQMIPKIDYQSLGNLAQTVVSGSIYALVYTILTVILSFYLLVDGKGAWKLFLIPFSDRLRYHMNAVKQKIDHCLYALLIGQVEIAAMTSLVMMVTYFSLGVPYAILFSVIQMLEIIPVVGTWTAIIPCITIICFTSSISKGLIAFLVYIVYTQIVRDSFITPRIMGTNLGFHPLAIIIAMVLGAQFGGIAGVILALPILAIVLSLIEYNVDLERLKISMRTSK